MSITVHQILNDAKRLVNRLREHDASAENIISQSQTLYKTVESMKECSEDFIDKQLENQSKMHRPLFVFNVQQENKHIRDLQEENKELRLMLEEHQSVLELIVSKYRYQITRLLNRSHDEQEEVGAPDLQQLQERTDRICKMADVMKESAVMDDNTYAQEQELLTELITENRGLRELLEISRSSGSLFFPINASETMDKEVQTDQKDVD